MTDTEAKLKELLQFHYPDNPVLFCELCHEAKGKHHIECKAPAILSMFREVRSHLSEAADILTELVAYGEPEEPLVIEATALLAKINGGE